MKTSAKPWAQGVIDNPNQYNLTDEMFSDFFELMRKKNMLAGNVENKTYSNITNGTFDDPNLQHSENCESYCQNEMRHFFEEYRNYHGYVSLVVSTAI
jgi:hypothetical protein